jgi:hypothetical protein
VNWTTPTDIKKQVHKLWDKGKLLSSMVGSNALFPYRLVLKGPSSSELSSEFAAVREWIERLRKDEEKTYRIVWRETNHRVLGRNSLPKEAWIDTLEGALNWIGKNSAARSFKKTLEETQKRHPALIPWLARQPLRALELADEWNRLLDIVTWVQSHPHYNIYLRQIDIPGLDTKFIENHRSVLSELMDLALPSQIIDATSTGATGFCRRYGFRDKPLRIRVRILDPGQSIFPSGDDQDITVTQKTFSTLDLPAKVVFITENETNFLAFPQIANGLVIFGSGYGFDVLTDACWLNERQIYYWGDIDTHGFAILNQLRNLFPHTHSLLMDRETFLSHRMYWGTEPKPENRDLLRLTDLESQLYDDLRFNSLGENLRLEQERIRFSRVENALQNLFPRAGDRYPVECKN